MEKKSQKIYQLFEEAIGHYHIMDHVDALFGNPYAEDSPDSMFYKKCWIDTVQWHLEDIIRDPDISAEYGLSIKRRIDNLNQKRTDIVELIDDYFLNLYRDVIPHPNARHNTESLGWAFDRLSILALKEYHVGAELNRKDAADEHIDSCLARKSILQSQKEDLFTSINWLMEDVRLGKKIIKVYRQLKMYNDKSFNPILYSKYDLAKKE